MHIVYNHLCHILQKGRNQTNQCVALLISASELMKLEFEIWAELR